MEASKPTTKVYSAKFDEVQVAILYRIIIQRIARHLSCEEVSFLMGKPLHFMADVETIKIKNILAIDLYFMKQVLEIKDYSALYPYTAKPSMEKALYRLKIDTYPDWVSYHMEKTTGKNKDPTTVFFLSDNNYAVEPCPDTAINEQEKLAHALDTLLHVGYFEEQRTPYELYRKCREVISDHIKPKNIIKVLSGFTERKEYPKLQRMMDKKIGYVYKRVDKE